MMKRTVLEIVLIIILFRVIAMAQTFREFLGSLERESDPAAKAALIDRYLGDRLLPVVEDNTVHFLYRGDVRVAAVPGEMNRWDPQRGIMHRVPGTDLYHLSTTVPRNGRIEYKLWIDSVWMLDPANPRRALGGYGENNDVWMPGYQPNSDDIRIPGLPEGTIDTNWIESTVLQRRHPVYVYQHPQAASERRWTLYVMDGGDYLSIGKMNIILDNLIGTGRMTPVVGVFIDPRSDPSSPATNMRRQDYAASDSFLLFLDEEVRPFVESRYPVIPAPDRRVMMGASLGGLIATYAVLARTDFAIHCAAQSPAYFQADSAVIRLLETRITHPGKIYIDTGTLNDTEMEARIVRSMFERRGVRVKFLELPEGHNWTNWRARIATILQYFFPNP